MRLTTTLLPLCILVLAEGCTSPHVVYYKDSQKILSNAPEGTLNFALRTSDITLDLATRTSDTTTTETKTPAPDTVTTDQAANNSRTARSQTSDKSTTTKRSSTHQTAPPPANQAPTTNPATNTGGSPKNVTNVDSCQKAKNWADCLAGVGVKVTPTAYSDITYSAVPDNHWYAHTELTSATLDTDALVPATVTVNFKNQLKTIATGAGTGATAGASLGPYGIAGGALLGALSTVNVSEDKKPHQFQLFVCKSDFPQDFQSGGLLTAPEPSEDKKTKAFELILPITITLGPDEIGTQATDTPDKAACWHLLPANSQLFTAQSSELPDPGYRGSGWLYRIRLGAVAKFSIPADAYFAPKPEAGSATNVATADTGSALRTDFPYSTCRKATIDIVWWSELEEAMKTDSKKPRYNYRSIATTIADPLNLGATPLPKAGTIKFKSLCGSPSVTKSSDSTSLIGDAGQEVLKQIKSVKDSQKSKTGSTGGKTTGSTGGATTGTPTSKTP